MTSSISVLMTTYNCASYISPAIKSILNQSYKDFEFLIIDDGSNDFTEEIVNRFSDVRIKYIKKDRCGRSSSLNYGLREAIYDVIALMDADDISHPLRFEKQLELLKNSHQLVFCDTAYFKENKIKYVILSPENELEVKKKLLLHGHFNNSSCMFSKTHVIENGGFNESLISYEDYDLWLRLMNKSQFVVVPGVYHYTRLRKGSMTTTDPIKLQHLVYQLQSKYYDDLSNQFGIADINEHNILKGWREFFYGKTKLCRKYWRKVKIRNWGKRIFIAYVLSILPLYFVNFFKKNRIRLRLQYLFNKKSKFRDLEKEFKSLLKQVSEK